MRHRKRLFPVKTECSDVRTDIPGETVPEGYFTPLPADVLVSTPFRKRCLLKNAVIMPVKYKNTVVATAKDTNGIYSAGDRANIYFYKGIVE